MKKLLVILFLLPIISLGQCGDINKENLIGAELTFGGAKNKLLKNGKIQAFSTSVDASGYYWSLNNNILKIKRGDYEYFLDLKSEILNGKVNKTWCMTNGKKHSSLLSDWQKFDKNYYHLLSNQTSNYSLCIKDYIIEKLKIWEEKGEFEKTTTFKERVNENSRKIKKEELKKEAVNFYKRKIIRSIKSSDLKLKKYNADNETFIISISNFEDINFPVPISKAESFKKKFNPSDFSNLDFVFAKDVLIISKIDINGLTYDLFSSE
tara:strand:+ start:1231 stop:2025 length:795 start_codon:yes stop_codon:yes gene_type:complete